MTNIKMNLFILLESQIFLDSYTYSGSRERFTDIINFKLCV